MENGLLEIIRNSIQNWKDLIQIDGNFNNIVKKTLEDCLLYASSTSKDVDELKIIQIDSVIDYLHDELNTGHWSEVPLYFKQYFTIANFIKGVILLKSTEHHSCEFLRECLKCIDTGLLLGCPLYSNLELLTNTAKILTIEINKASCNYQISADNCKTKRVIEENEIYEKLDGVEIDSVECPSLEYFEKQYFKTQIPVKLTGCMKHWLAIKKWMNVNYLLSIAGDRTVPIEIGSHYVDENWSQKLMTLREFIIQYYLSENGEVGYLAQHNLFNQITELKDDIHIPDYCCLSLNYDNYSEPDINAWLGPKGTVSPLHHDPKNNILAQVYGSKQLILFSPNDSPYLYSHKEKLLDNTAQVDPLQPNLEKYPEFSKAKMYKCLLNSEEMLFIPVKWWHHVTALDKSFSVSFWWQ